MSHNDLVKLSQVTDGLQDFSKIWQFCAELKLFKMLLIASIVAIVRGIQDAPLDTSDWLLLVRRPRRGKRGREEREETEKKDNFKGNYTSEGFCSGNLNLTPV